LRTIRMTIHTHSAQPKLSGKQGGPRRRLTENWLSNRVFRSDEDILDHCCAAWNKLIDQPWRIMSIGLRDWAHRF
jgi:hypothetical protein